MPFEHKLHNWFAPVEGPQPVHGSYFVFMPLKIARCSGGPGRALAYVPR